jgi:hypothetical protein
MLYISDIYNVFTHEHFKYLDLRVKNLEFYDSYCVELRDFVTGEKRVLCKPNVVFEYKYRKNQIGIVTANRIHVISKSFINLLSYLDVERVSSSENIPNDIIIATEFNLKNTDCLWYNQITATSSGRREVKYFDLFEFLVAVQNLHQEINLYGVVKRKSLNNNNFYTATTDKTDNPVIVSYEYKSLSIMKLLLINPNAFVFEEGAFYYELSDFDLALKYTYTKGKEKFDIALTKLRIAGDY